MGGGLGDAQDQGVAGAGEQVARVSARHGGETGGQPRQGVPAGRGEDHGRQRNDHDIGGVRGVVRHHARHHHDRREDDARRIEQGPADGGGEQARPLGYRGPVDDGDDDPQGREVRQGPGHADEQSLQIGGRQEALRLKHFARHRVDRRPAQPRADQAQDHETQDQPKE
ncbi:hypothetical protein D3C80_1271820 [compost metagenome]